MGWWPFLRRRGALEPPDYYREGLKLSQEEKYHEALTSFRLALRERPDDPEIMQQMGVIYTQIGMPDEAIRFYTRAVDIEWKTPGAHYGLAFLFLHRGDREAARRHLRAFLDHPPEHQHAEAHIRHARQTIAELDAGRSGRATPADGGYADRDD